MKHANTVGYFGLWLPEMLCLTHVVKLALCALIVDIKILVR